MSLEFESTTTNVNDRVVTPPRNLRKESLNTANAIDADQAIDTDQALDNAQAITNQPKESSESFAETALRLGGATDEEAQRTGVIDSADDRVEQLFDDQYKTINSPIHRAVWGSLVPTELFSPNPSAPTDRVASVVERSLAIVRKHRDTGTLVNHEGKIDPLVLSELGGAGYWGLLVGPQYGGSGATMRDFTGMITRMATIDPTVAGLASVHGCIGAVDPVRAFGTQEQKQRFLPGLADGSQLSGFALTEPGAGSDLTALKTTAVRVGDQYLINGEKLFITNATYGRTIGLVCNIDDQPSVLIVELPESDTSSFSINRYGIYALSRAQNNGLVFKDFRVPVANRLIPQKGDGLTIAYHGLNLGRVSLCANAAGAMRWMLAEMLPWANYRVTYGQPIDRRELVQRRIGRLASLIVGCDALTHWCASLLDQGYRGEMECIIAKIFGSESQKEAAIELLMKTHGGRSFLAGHLFGDNVHDFLAPCIYEGEGEMLGLALFKSLVKQHGKSFFEPIGMTLHQLGVRQPNPLNPHHLWKLKKPLCRYAAWLTKRSVLGSRWANLDMQPNDLAGHVKFAQRYLSKSGLRISNTMRRHQLRLADRQCQMSLMSTQIQQAVTMLVTALYASSPNTTLPRDPVTVAAADCLCRSLRRQLTGALPTDEEMRALTRLGELIAQSGWTELESVQSGSILQPYK